MDKSLYILDSLIERYEKLSDCRSDIEKAYFMIKKCFERGNKIIICGNGGSASDSSHIAGELMKGFHKRRELSDSEKNSLLNADTERGRYLAENLQGALPAIALNTNSTVITAVLNDMDSSLIYAQQVKGYGRKGDILMCISTSGNAENVINAAVAATAFGLGTVGLTGEKGGELFQFCDVCIRVPALSAAEVQELHVPVYHALCTMIEESLF